MHRNAPAWSYGGGDLREKNVVILLMVVEINLQLQHGAFGGGTIGW